MASADRADMLIYTGKAARGYGQYLSLAGKTILGNEQLVSALRYYI
jgi:hypothetical protein